ncbi:hypothetical protein Btru_060419 [Bulinus truncatus]|nr:hypothetical protein Btru_060419 [Bulinus truncatus]
MRFQQQGGTGVRHAPDGEYSSLNECLLSCSEGCTGVSYVGSTCYRHTPCTPADPACAPVANLSVAVFEKLNPCLNGGQWDQVTDTCNCTGGYVTSNCERYAQTSEELALSGYAFAEHDVTLQRREPSSEMPDLVSLPGRVLPGRQQLLDRSGEHEVAERQRDAPFIPGDSGRGLRYAYRYENFSMESASKVYSFQFITAVKVNPTNSTKIYGDCLEPVKGVGFSNTDYDNDLDPGHSCATQGGAAWWWGTCSALCNPLGSWKEKRWTGST